MCAIFIEFQSRCTHTHTLLQEHTKTATASHEPTSSDETTTHAIFFMQYTKYNAYCSAGHRIKWPILSAYILSDLQMDSKKNGVHDFTPLFAGYEPTGGKKDRNYRCVKTSNRTNARINEVAHVLAMSDDWWVIARDLSASFHSYWPAVGQQSAIHTGQIHNMLAQCMRVVIGSKVQIDWWKFVRAKGHQICIHTI